MGELPSRFSAVAAALRLRPRVRRTSRARHDGARLKTPSRRRTAAKSTSRRPANGRRSRPCRSGSHGKAAAKPDAQREIFPSRRFSARPDGLQFAMSRRRRAGEIRAACLRDGFPRTPGRHPLTIASTRAGTSRSRRTARSERGSPRARAPNSPRDNSERPAAARAPKPTTPRRPNATSRRPRRSE